MLEAAAAPPDHCAKVLPRCAVQISMDRLAVWQDPSLHCEARDVTLRKLTQGKARGYVHS